MRRFADNDCTGVVDALEKTDFTDTLHSSDRTARVMVIIAIAAAILALIVPVSFSTSSHRPGQRSREGARDCRFEGLSR